jgi:WD40 repeat protein
LCSVQNYNHTTHVEQLVTSLSATSSDSLLLTASKDNSLALLDFRTMSTQCQLRAPSFMVRNKKRFHSHTTATIVNVLPLGSAAVQEEIIAQFYTRC